jgi:hypothetical protein
VRFPGHAIDLGLPPRILGCSQYCECFTDVAPSVIELVEFRMRRASSLVSRFTPAMAAGVTDKLWGISDIVKVLEDWEEADE